MLKISLTAKAYLVSNEIVITIEFIGKYLYE
jgi:hypothetical protein